MRELTKTLRRLAQLSGKTEAQIAKHGGLDPAYVRKLMSGQKWNPTEATLIKLAVGIVFDPALYDRHGERPEVQHPLAHLVQALQADRLRDAIGTFKEQVGDVAAD